MTLEPDPTEAGQEGERGRTVAAIAAQIKAADNTDGQTLRDWQGSVLLARITELEKQLEVVREALRDKPLLVDRLEALEEAAQRVVDAGYSDDPDQEEAAWTMLKVVLSSNRGDS